jgi:RNA polymerase sigma-70 factor (family 1)
LIRDFYHQLNRINFFVTIHSLKALPYRKLSLHSCYFKLMVVYESLTDIELTDLIREGDVAAFTHLYKQYSGQMYANVLKLVKDELIAEEIVQEIFTKIWQKRAVLNFEQSVVAYLYRVGRNLVNDFYRKLRRDQAMYDHFKAIATEHYTHIEEALQAQDNEQVMRKALSGLPPQQKKVYELCKLEGHTYKEVAAMLGISPNTVKEHLSKANYFIKNYLLNNIDSTFSLLLYILLRQKR